MKYQFPIYGLVVCGGKSTRMGTDKSTLEYYGQPQRYHVYKMLESICDQAFISCNANQVKDIPPAYNTLPDDPEYGDIGPMAALLTAFDRFPDARFIAVGCDYPFLTKPDLEALISQSFIVDNSVCYRNADSDINEPLLAVYHDNIRPHLQSIFMLSSHSLSRLLTEVKAGYIASGNAGRLASIDTREDYEKALKLIREQGINKQVP